MIDKIKENVKQTTTEMKDDFAKGLAASENETGINKQKTFIKSLSKKTLMICVAIIVVLIFIFTRTGGMESAVESKAVTDVRKICGDSNLSVKTDIIYHHGDDYIVVCEFKSGDIFTTCVHYNAPSKDSIKMVHSDQTSGKHNYKKDLKNLKKKWGL